MMQLAHTPKRLYRPLQIVYVPVFYWVDSSQKSEIIKSAEVVFAAAAAGVQVLSAQEIQSADKLLVTADVNAVPPAGVEGMELFMNGEPLPGCQQTLGVGPLAIGDIKYKTESGLFKRMISSTEPVHLDFRDAFTLARSFVA